MKRYGARSICEYCLAAQHQVGDPRGGVGDLAQQALGLHRVGQPADRALQRGRCRRRRTRPPGRPTPSPPATNTGASSQPPVTSCSSSQSPSSSSRSDASRGESAGACRTFLTNSSCASTSFCSCAPASLPEAIMASLCRMPGHPVAQRVGGPAGGGRRVVQLVGQPGRELAQRQQPLPLPEQRVAAAHPEDHALEQVHGHREPAGELLGELGGGQREHRAVGDRAHRRRVVRGPSRRRGRTGRPRSRRRGGRCGWSRRCRRRSSGSSRSCPDSST